MSPSLKPLCFSAPIFPISRLLSRPRLSIQTFPIMTSSILPPPSSSSHAYSIAPMMEVTDRHFRALSRLISRHATLYTEMVVDNTLIHNPILRYRELRIPSSTQHPLVLQLGGSDPNCLTQATRFAAEAGYSEINLNCGCPSPKVAGRGCFGAALMKSPDLVATATREMKKVLPENGNITVKCRIGVDDDESYESLCKFIKIVHEKGMVNHFIIHARKAILGGLSPAQNRTIPPLKYEYVHGLLKDFPNVKFSINGGLKTVNDVKEQLGKGLHGVMVGRAVMDRPWHALCDVDQIVYNDPNLDEHGNPITRALVLQKYVDYAEKEIEETGCSVRATVKPLLNLFAGEKNGKRFRRVIDETLRIKDIGIREVVDKACQQLSRDVLMAVPPSMRAEDNVEELEKLMKEKNNILDLRNDQVADCSKPTAIPNVCS